MGLVAFVGGSGFFFAFLIFMVVAVIYSLFTRTGSGINQRPYGKVHGGAPGARGHSNLSGSDERERDWSRGTR